MAWPTAFAVAGGRDEDLFVRAEDLRTVLFGSLDVGRSVFLSAGAKQTLTGPLDRDGYVAMTSSGFGLTQERFGPDPRYAVTRLTTQSNAMLGHQWAMTGLYVAAYLGTELEQNQASVAGRVLHWSKPRLGPRAQLEVWAHPTTDTLATATLISGGARGHAYGRVSAGLRVWRNVFVGPEAVGYATLTYRELKLGAHLTGLQLGLVALRLSGGWQLQDDGRPGAPYVALTAYMRM